MSAKGQKSALVTSKRDKGLAKKKSTTLLLPEGTYNLASNRRNSLEDGTESSDGESQRKTQMSQSARDNKMSSRILNNAKTNARLANEPTAPKKKSPSSYIDYRVYINDRYIQMEEDQERRQSISKLKLQDEAERYKYRAAAPAFNYFNSSNPPSSRYSDEVAADEPMKTKRSMSAAPISLFQHQHRHFDEHRNSTTSYPEKFNRNRMLNNLDDLSASFNDSIFIQSVSHFKRPINV